MRMARRPRAPETRGRRADGYGYGRPLFNRAEPSMPAIRGGPVIRVDGIELCPAV